MIIKVPEYEGKEKEFRDFIKRHKDYIEYDDIRNSDAVLRRAFSGEEININYGEFCELEEIVYHVLVEEYHIECEYIPRGYDEIGIGEKGQKDNLISMDEKYKDMKEIKALMEGRLDW